MGICRNVALVRDVSGVEAVRRTNDRKRKEEDKVGKTSRRKETLVKTGGLVWKVGGKTLIETARSWRFREACFRGVRERSGGKMVAAGKKGEQQLI